MKAHIGVDDASGLVHHVECTAANVSDVTQAHKLLHTYYVPSGPEKFDFAAAAAEEAARAAAAFSPCRVLSRKSKFRPKFLTLHMIMPKV